MVQTACAASFHVPGAIPRLDEAIDRSRKRRIAKNIGMMGWIDTVQAARFHESTPILVTAPRGVPPPIRTSGSGAQNNRADDRYNRQESCIPPHRYLLLNPKKIERQDGELTFLQPASGLALVPSMPATRLGTQPWPYPAKARAASSCSRSVRSSRLRNSLARQGNRPKTGIDQGCSSSYTVYKAGIQIKPSTPRCAAGLPLRGQCESSWLTPSLVNPKMAQWGLNPRRIEVKPHFAGPR